jgi:hypothetical protein
MKKNLPLLFIAILISTCRYTAFAQSLPSHYQFADIDLAIGKTEGTVAFSFNYDKGLGLNKKIVLGFGARLTTYLGKNQYYVTAPARLTSGSTGPGVLFKENITANMDTFLIKSAQVNSINLFITLGYNFSKKLMLRFNIDAVGFSFGKDVTGNYINGAQGSVEVASPTPFNVLLISDNDKGSLNSQLLARYLVNDKWGIKGGVQFLFTEYTTGDEVQQFPEPNDRFRRKSLMISAGVSYQL